jgi:hypothetical protein
MHWGLVNSRTQTHLAWGARPGKPVPTLWQHDLFHGDHTPRPKSTCSRKPSPRPASSGSKGGWTSVKRASRISNFLVIGAFD